MAITDTRTQEEQANLRIVIADDHALVRGGLALMIDLATPGTEVLQANSLDQVTDILSQTGSVDLLLLDLMMPGMDGVAGIEAICKSWPEVPVVIVSVTEDVESIRRCLTAGAMGYIPKTSFPNVTISAIRLVLDGGIYVPPHVLRPSDATLDSKEKTPSVIHESGLTRRQLQVLDLLKAGKSNNAIAGELGLSTGTIKLHVSGIFKKLKVSNRTEAVAIYTSMNENKNPS
ncbi:MAG: DNA-binding NarL/FixJ family response regulator [Parasphingorhabdus sp.]|jgi:DNA-binding NarL/FixJ family response regulator